jgi:hypothetical protein
MYNTLGNWEVDGRAGLLFVDFDQHRHLQMTGRVEVRWSERSASAATGGTNRFWDFHVEGWFETQWPAVLTWELLEPSPYLPA